VPGPGGWGAERAVYQVKRFCENLTGGQKRKIKSSYQRVVATSKKEGWKITEWHLVMPLDLTTQNLSWLDDVVVDSEFNCETNGLVFCDTLAASYPKVIDYYLRDGKERLQAELNNLTAILSRRTDRQQNDALLPTDVLTDLASIHKGINACDPFYKYEGVHVVPGHPVGGVVHLGLDRPQVPFMVLGDKVDTGVSTGHSSHSHTW
jgi:hypothetical protein